MWIGWPPGGGLWAPAGLAIVVVQRKRNSADIVSGPCLAIFKAVRSSMVPEIEWSRCPEVVEIFSLGCQLDGMSSLWLSFLLAQPSLVLCYGQVTWLTIYIPIYSITYKRHHYNCQTSHLIVDIAVVFGVSNTTSSTLMTSVDTMVRISHMLDACSSVGLHYL